MVTMHILRMLVDVSFFCTFAGFVATQFGAGGVFLGMLIQCLCYGFSGLAGNRKLLRLTALVPMILCWVISWHNIAECILLIPTAIYIIWLVWRGDYALDRDRQEKLFGVFFIAVLVLIPVLALAGHSDELTTVSIPYALVMLICSVLLLRALRHDAKTYCSKRYQLVNISTVVLALAAAYLVSSKAFLQAVGTALKAVFNTVIQPIIALLLNIILGVIWCIGWLVSKLNFGAAGNEQEEIVQIDLSGTKEIIPDDLELKEPNELLRAVAIVLIVAAVIVLLVRFFRWLNKRRGGGEEIYVSQEQRDGVEIVRMERKEKESQPVKKIRAQYRGFLKWCAGAGIHTEKTTTTLDVHRGISVVKGCGETSQKIRKLYIQARYADRANRDAVKEMKQLCEQVKKENQ